MIRWFKIARDHGCANPQQLMQKYYINHGLSISALARLFDVSSGSIRNKLIELEIERKPRGGPNHTLDVEVTYEEYMKYTMENLCKMKGMSRTKWFHLTRNYPPKSGRVRRKKFTMEVNDV